jgi:hypothetical protein
VAFKDARVPLFPEQPTTKHHHGVKSFRDACSHPLPGLCNHQSGHVEVDDGAMSCSWSLPSRRNQTWRRKPWAGDQSSPMLVNKGRNGHYSAGRGVPIFQKSSTAPLRTTLHVGGALALQMMAAPGMPHCPWKNARYVEDAEYCWWGVHFQTNLSGRGASRWTSVSYHTTFN